MQTNLYKVNEIVLTIFLSSRKHGFDNKKLGQYSTNGCILVNQ